MQPLRTDKKRFYKKMKHEAATKWLIPKLVCVVDRLERRLFEAGADMPRVDHCFLALSRTVSTSEPKYLREIPKGRFRFQQTPVYLRSGAQLSAMESD